MTKTKITFGLFKCWRAISTGVLAVLLTTSASAQQFNIDCSSTSQPLGISNWITVNPAVPANQSCGYRLILPTDLLAAGDAVTATLNGDRYFTQIERNGTWFPQWTPGTIPPSPGVIVAPLTFAPNGQATISAADVGTSFKVRVVRIDPLTLQIAGTCWKWVNIEDKSTPIIRCPARTTISCLQQPTLAIAGTLQAALLPDNNPLGPLPINQTDIDGQLEDRFPFPGFNPLTGQLDPATSVQVAHLPNSTATEQASGWFYDCSGGTVRYTDTEFETSCTAPFNPANLPAGLLALGGLQTSVFNNGIRDAALGGILDLGIETDGTIANDVEDILLANPNSIIKFIVRQFTVTDAYGNFSTCNQVIGVKRMDASMTVIKPFDIALNCSTPMTDFSPEALHALNTAASGFWTSYPLLFVPKTGNTPIPCGSITTIAQAITATTVGVGGVIYDAIQLKPNSTTCGISVTYTDNDLNLCTGSFKKLRNWRLQNWCGANVTICPSGVVSNASVIELGEQAIKYLDLSAPVVKANYTTYSLTSNLLCTRTPEGGLIPAGPLSTFKNEVTAQAIRDAAFTGSTIEGILPNNAGTVWNVTALGNSNDCGGSVSIQLTASDVGCTAISGQVTVTTTDSRLVASRINYSATSGETTLFLTGSFPLSTDANGDGAITAADGYLVTVTIADACGYAKATQQFRILVVDNAKPEPVCVEYLQLALGTNGTVRLQATSLNRASYDNCTDQRNLRYLVRKMRTANSDGTASVDVTEDCFSTSVDFTCAEAKLLHDELEAGGTATTLGVIMRVCDQVGNYNDCMVQVLVEDKIRPTCIAPPAMVVRCNQFANLWDMSNYGAEPVIFDNCLNPTITPIDPIVNLNNCRQGTITRSWVVEDAAGNRASGVCSQVITVRGTSDFSVDFPDDVVASCYDEVQTDDEAKNAMLTNPVTVDGHLENNGCGVLAVEVTHTTADAAPGGSCYKIFRKYRVIDWCRYNPHNSNESVSCYGRPIAGDRHNANPNGFDWNNPVSGNSPSWEHLDIPVAAGLLGTYVPASLGTDIQNNRTRRGNPRERKFRDADIYDFSHVPSTAALDNIRLDSVNAIYAPNSRNTNLAPTNRDHWSFADGIICFVQTVKLIDNVRPTVTAIANDLERCDYGSAANCAAQYTQTLEGADLCQGGIGTDGLTYAWNLVRADGLPIVAAVGATPAVMSYTGVTNTISIASLPYDITYRVNWTVSDRCGNYTADEYEIRFRDCKKPAISCININAELMPVGAGAAGGQIAIWPSELLNSVADNCTDQAYLRSRTRVRIAGAGSGFPETGTSVVLTCDNYNATPEHRVVVEVWTQDLRGNADFCLATVTLQNNMGACGASGVVANVNGSVQTEARTNIENVAVKATLNGQLAASMTTRTDGAFALAGLTVGQNYAIRGERVDNILNGVTTYDIALISRHILGTETLTSPYKVIAADVNGDRDVNTADMIALRRAVLHLSPVFPNNVRSWKFINKTYTFQNATSPLGEDFPEVVNIANAPQGLSAANFVGVKVGDVNLSATANGLAGLDIRGAAGTVTLKTDDLNLVAGKTYTVQLKSDDFKVVGMQGTFNFAKGYADQIAVVGQLPNMTEGNFGVFENAITTSWNGKAAAETDVLTLTFRAKQNGKLSEVLTIGSNLTYAEGYDAAGDSYSVNLSFNNGKVSGKEFALYQNEPNPSNSNTKIGFNLPEAAKATLSIYDVTGKLLRMVEGNYNAGYNALMIEKSDLNANGVMYYRLDSGNNTATKKMIIIE